MRAARASADSRCVMIIAVRFWTKCFQHALNQLLALQVHLAGGLVEDQDRRIAEDRPGQGNPLPLPAREPAPQLPHHRLVPWEAALR